MWHNDDEDNCWVLFFHHPLMFYGRFVGRSSSFYPTTGLWSCYVFHFPIINSVFCNCRRPTADSSMRCCFYGLSWFAARVSVEINFLLMFKMKYLHLITLDAVEYKMIHISRRPTENGNYCEMMMSFIGGMHCTTARRFFYVPTPESIHQFSS